MDTAVMICGHGSRDPEAIADPAAFSTCLREGFDEVIALVQHG